MTTIEVSYKRLETVNDEAMRRAIYTRLKRMCANEGDAILNMYAESDETAGVIWNYACLVVSLAEPVYGIPSPTVPALDLLDGFKRFLELSADIGNALVRGYYEAQVAHIAPEHAPPSMVDTAGLTDDEKKA